jgi:hypothetical protein
LHRPSPQPGEALADKPSSRDRVTGEVLNGCGQEWLRRRLQTAGAQFRHVQFPNFVPALARGGVTGGLECFPACLTVAVLPFPHVAEAGRLGAGLGQAPR